jgi:transposase-like protein
MPEVRKVQTDQVDERCPVCKNGWMRPTGIIPSSGQYEHQCTSCQYKQIYSVRYPYIVG